MNNITSSSTNFIRDILARVENWDEFEEHAAFLGNAQKGKLFEHLVKHYLELDPIYQSKLEKVWLLADIPANPDEYYRDKGWKDYKDWLGLE